MVVDHSRQYHACSDQLDKCGVPVRVTFTCKDKPIERYCEKKYGKWFTSLAVANGGLVPDILRQFEGILLKEADLQQWWDWTETDGERTRLNHPDGTPVLLIPTLGLEEN